MNVSMISIGGDIPPISKLVEDVIEYPNDSRLVGIIGKDVNSNLICNTVTLQAGGKIFTAESMDYKYTAYNGSDVTWFSNGVLRTGNIEIIENVISVNNLFICAIQTPTPKSLSFVSDTSSNLYVALSGHTHMYLSSSNSLIFSQDILEIGTSFDEYPGPRTETIEVYLGLYALAFPVNGAVDVVDITSILYEVSPKEIEYEYESGTYEIKPDEIFTATIKFDSNTYEGRAFYHSISPIDEAVSYKPFYDTLTINTDEVIHPSYDIKISQGNGVLYDTCILKILNYTGKHNHNPYNPGGTSSSAGGGGSFGKKPDGTPIISDDISVDVPSGSTIGKDSSTGMYTRYLMNTQYLELLGDWVYDPSLGLSLIIVALENIYGKASDAMISLLSFPFSLTAPLTGITSIQQPLYFGHQPTGGNFLALTSGSCTIDWGTLNLYEYWGNFLDYAPHTKIEMFLPWGTGFVPIDPGQCLPGTLKVVTNIEFARGSCVHNIINQDGCVIGTYAGQPGSLVPLISSDIAAKRAGLVIGAVSLAVGGAVAAAAPAIASMSAGSAYGSSIASKAIPSLGGKQLSGAARTSFQGRVQSSAMENAMSAYSNTSESLATARRTANRVASDASIAAMRHHVEISRNGGFGDANAGMMVQYPYIIISRPEQNVPKDYGHYYGYPSNIYENLSNLTGYTEVAAIHLDGINATEPELDEIDSLLKGGVIL